MEENNIIININNNYFAITELQNYLGWKEP